eukprot:g61124.t1
MLLLFLGFGLANNFEFVQERLQAAKNNNILEISHGNLQENLITFDGLTQNTLWRTCSYVAFDTLLTQPRQRLRKQELDLPGESTQISVPSRRTSPGEAGYYGCPSPPRNRYIWQLASLARSIWLQRLVIRTVELHSVCTVLVVLWKRNGARCVSSGDKKLRKAKATITIFRWPGVAWHQLPDNSMKIPHIHMSTHVWPSHNRILNRILSCK